MKRKILFILFLFATSLYSNDITKVKSFESDFPKSRIFNGFDFKDFDPLSDVSTTDIVEAEIEKILLEDEKIDNHSEYTIIGHSEGGLRVLAYATILEKKMNEEPDLNKRDKYKDLYNRLQAIITVSGIDRGFKALDQDAAVFISRLEEDIDILLGGIDAIKSLKTYQKLDEFCSFNDAIDSYINKYVQEDERFSINDKITKKNVQTLILNMLPDNIQSYIKPAIINKTVQNMPEIRDLVPNSEFIKNNVAEQKEVVYKVRDGTKKVWDWYYKKVLGVKVYYYGYKTETVYKTVKAYYDIPKFNKNIPIGYIVGLENNSLQLLEDANNKQLGIEAATEKYLKKANVVLNISREIYITKVHLIYGLFDGSQKEYKRIIRTQEWVNNYQSEINDLLGSDSNDGLIAEESQFYPKSFYNPSTKETIVLQNKVLGVGEKENYVSFANLNHKTIGPFVTDAEKRLGDLGVNTSTSYNNLRVNDPVFMTIDKMISESYMYKED